MSQPNEPLSAIRNSYHGLETPEEVEPPKNKKAADLARLREMLSAGVNLKSPATVRAYRADWARFEAFCQREHYEALPADADTIALFLLKESEQGSRASTINRRCAAITHYHLKAGVDAPISASLVQRARRMIRRKLGTRRTQKRPLKLELLKQAIAQLPDTLMGKRNKALLLLGWAGGFRRSELVSLRIENLTWVAQGLIVVLPKSKTDQEGEGQIKGIPHGTDPTFCPVKAVEVWMKAAGITDGPLLRSVNRWGKVGEKACHPEVVAEVVKASALAIGADPAQFSGHSLRAGVVSSAAEGGADVYAIMLTTGHRSEHMVREYIRESHLFKNHAATKAGL